MKKCSYFIGLFALGWSLICHAATESAMHHYVEAHTPNQIALLKKLVNINSGTSNIKGVKRVGEIIRKELHQLGFKTKWVNAPANMQRAPTLVATHRGTQGDRLLLIGHLDTVFAASSTFQQFQMKKHTAKGPGVIDDKGGLVVMLYALKALHAQHMLDKASITIVLTGDEEDSGKPASISRRPLFEAAKQADVALDFEPTITLNTASVSRRGVNQWVVESHGNESHSATIFLPDVGDGALFELARILMAMRAEFKNEKYLTMNPGIALGGNKMTYDALSSQGRVFGKQNVVAKTALVAGDYRYINAEQKKSFEDKMKALVAQSLPGTHSTITFGEGMPAMQTSQRNIDLLNQYSEASIQCGYGVVKPLDAGVRGAGDISYVAEIVPANLAGLGPMGFGTHSVIESIELSSLPIQTERAAMLMRRLIRHDFSEINAL